MADLEIKGLFDVSGIVKGIQEAAEAMQEGASEITGSFAQMEASEAAFTAAGLGASNLIEQLTGIREEVDAVATSLENLGAVELAVDEIPPPPLGQVAGTVTPNVVATPQATSEPPVIVPTPVPAPTAPEASSPLGQLSSEEASAETSSLAGLNEALAGLSVTEVGAAIAAEKLGQSEQEITVSTPEAATASKELASSIVETSSKSELASESLHTVGPAAQSSTIELTGLEGGLNSAGVGASNLISQITGVTEGVTGFTPSVSQMDSVLREMAVAQEEGQQSASSLAQSQEAVAPAVESVSESITAQDAGFSAMQTVQTEAISETQQLASAQAQLAESMAGSGLAAMQEVQESTTSLATSQAAGADAAVTYTQSQEELAASMAGSGLGAMQEVQASTIALTEAQAASTDVATTNATAQQEAAAGAAQLGIVMNSQTKAVVALAEAMEFLNNQAAVTGASSDLVAQKQEIARQAAQKLGLQLVETAAGLKLVAISADEAADSTDRLSGRMTYAAGRAAAWEMGMGGLGSSVALMARESSALSAILSVAFPIIGAVALIEVVDTLVQKFEKAEDEVRKTIVGFDDLASSSYEVANSIELQNLKMEDQITKLEGRPTENRLKEALIETEQAASKLNKTLSQSIEKSIELLEKADVSIFKSLVSGQEPTSLVFGLDDDNAKIKESLSVFELAVEKRRAANEALSESDTEANRKAVIEADQRVETTRKAALEELRIRQEAINTQKTLQETKGPVPSGLPGGPTIQGAGLPPDVVDQKFAQQETAITRTRTMIEELARAEREEKQAAEDRNKVAIGGNVVEAHSRDKTVAEAEIKAAEASAQTTLELTKRTSSTKLKEAEDSAKLQLARDISDGAERAKAEQDADAKILAAKKQYYQDLIKAEQDYKNATVGPSGALQQQAVTIQQDVVGPQRIAQLTANGERIVDQTRKIDSEIESLQTASSSALLESEAKQITEEVALRTEGYKRVIDSEREQARQLIASSADVASQEETRVKETADVKLKFVQAEESLHTLTAQQGLQQRVAILEEEKVSVREAVDAHVASLEHLRNEVSTLWESLAVAGALPETLRPLRNEYDQLTIAIQKATTAQENLDQKIASTEIDAAIAKWKEEESAVSQFVSSSESAMTDFIGNVALTTHTLGQDLNSLFVSIGRDFLNMITKMIEQTALFKAVQNELQNTLNSIFRIPSSPVKAGPTPEAVSTLPLGGPSPEVQQTIASAGTPGETAAENQKVATATTTSSQIETIQEQTNAQLQALYQQDAANYASAQAQKTGQAGREVASATQDEAQKTSVAQAGESQRVVLASTESSQKNTQELSQVGAHAASEAQKTAVTATGETQRAVVTSAGTTKQVAQEATKVTAHTASESTQTTATVAGETQRQSIGLIGLAKHLAITVEKTIAHLLGVGKETGATTAGQAAQTSAVAAGASIRTTTTIAENSIQVLSEAGLAAAAAFASVMEALPFPVNVAVAPGVAAESFGETLGFGFAAKGGHIKGPGTGTSDSIPTMLSAGEYVVKASAVEKVGLPLLESINSEQFSVGGLVQRFAEGGRVSELANSSRDNSSSDNSSRDSSDEKQLSLLQHFASGGKVSELASNEKYFSHGGEVQHFADGGPVQIGILNSSRVMAEGGSVEKLEASSSNNTRQEITRQETSQNTKQESDNARQETNNTRQVDFRTNELSSSVDKNKASLLAGSNSTKSSNLEIVSDKFGSSFIGSSNQEKSATDKKSSDYITLAANKTAFGFAEKGALLNSDMPIFAHTNEMILPSHISTGLQEIITGKSSFTASPTSTSQAASEKGHTIQVTVSPVIHAIDGPSVSRFFSDHQDKLGASVTQAIRKGLVKVNH